MKTGLSSIRGVGDVRIRMRTGDPIGECTSGQSPPTYETGVAGKGVG